MAGRFSGRVAVVTGGGGGLGRASAQRLATDGAHVVVVDINEVAAQEVAALVHDAGLPVEAIVSTAFGCPPAT